MARAGAAVFHAGCVGIGGEPLVEILRSDGVDTDFILPVESIQGNAIIQVDPTGENCILLYGGSNQSVTEKQVEETLHGFGMNDYLLLQNEINLLSAIVDAPGEYRVKYYRDAQGKELDSDLDYHLRVGNDSENLLRIYFLHDDERQRIVIGSLPDHLTTFSIQ